VVCLPTRSPTTKGDYQSFDF